MKLNLLPTTEKKSRAGRTAGLVAAVIVASAIGLSIAMMIISKTALEHEKSAIGDLPQQVADADATSKSADTIIASAADVIRNAQLAQAMIDHNDVYPKLYDDVKRYIPPYYRLQTISATPLSATQSRLTLVGTLQGYQKYADLMLALMRFKDAATVTRTGYALNDPVVPAIDLVDPKGVMRKAGESPVPEDGLERLAYFQAKAAAAPSGYLNSGGYGSGTTETRGALPNASVVTIQMDVNRNLQVPLAAETLRAAGSATAGVAGGPPVVGGAPVGGQGPAAPPGSGRGGAD